MNLLTAFPQLTRQDELAWLEKAHARGAEEEDLRYCESLCALIACVDKSNEVALHDVLFQSVVNNKGKTATWKTTSPWYSIAERLYRVTNVAWRSWKTETTGEAYTVLARCLGVYCFMKKHARCWVALTTIHLTEMMKKLEDLYPKLQAAVEWGDLWERVAVRGQDPPPRDLLPRAISALHRMGTTKSKALGERRELGMTLFQAAAALHAGCYSEAARLYQSAVDTGHWAPPDKTSDFLGAHAAGYYNDLPHTTTTTKPTAAAEADAMYVCTATGQSPNLGLFQLANN